MVDGYVGRVQRRCAALAGVALSLALAAQIFLRDRCRDDGVAIPGCTPATTLVSVAPDRGLGIANSEHPALAEGGSTTAFLSAASNLLGPGVDANGLRDVFAKDR